MPTQRTLLMMIVGLVVMLSFSIGYIAGKPTAPQSTVQALTHSERVTEGRLVHTKKNDPVKLKTGSSYNAVYAEDDDVIYPAKSLADHKVIENSAGEKKPKFVFRKLPKAKPAYSWRRKKIVQQDRRETGIEQGDGYYNQPHVRQQPMRPRYRQQQPVQPRYYNPTPPQSGYGMPSPFMNNNYPMFPRTQDSYRAYGR